MLHRYELERHTAEQQTVQNLVEAGIITPSETDGMFKYLQDCDSKDVLAVLLESQNLREQATNPIKFYPVDMRMIGRN